jgi:ubiquitin-protein ligase
MTPRLRRLNADYQRVQAVFANHPFIRLVEVAGSPPEKYTVEFSVPALVPVSEDSQTIGITHRAEVFLPIDFPRRPPFCRMITPVFHPNIDPQKICIGDHWSAGQTLDALIIRIAEMICFQSYNTKSPLNAAAAAWAEAHLHELPLLKADLACR